MDFKQAIIENAWGGISVDYGMLHLQLATPAAVLVIICIMIFTLNKLLFQPVIRTLDNRKEIIAKSQKRVVQVEGEINDTAINTLEKGVKLKDGITKPATVKKIEEPSWLWTRSPPIRVRKNIPTSWIELSIIEGKNRQVRRMTASVGFPTLRLIRTSIDQWNLGNLSSGSYVTL